MSQAWLEGFGSPTSTMERIAEMSPSNIVSSRHHMRYCTSMVWRMIPQNSDLQVLGVRHMFIWSRKGERKGNIHLEVVQFVSLQIAVWVGTSFIFPRIWPRLESALYQIRPDSTRSHSKQARRVDFTTEISLDMRKCMLETENITFYARIYNQNQTRMCTWNLIERYSSRQQRNSNDSKFFLARQEDCCQGWRPNL